MFAKYQIDSALNQEIIAALSDLESLRDEPEKYNAAVRRIAELQKLKPEKAFRSLSLDTVVAASANLIGILWLTSYERDRPITSKALSFVMRVK